MNDIFVLKNDTIIALTDYAKTLESVEIPACVKKIGNSAFRGAKNLKSVTFEKGSQLETVGDSAFRDCVMLDSITLPESVKTVGELAFYNTAQKTYDRLYNKNVKNKKYFAPKWTYEFMGEDVLPIGAYIEPSVGYFAENVTLDWNIREFAQSGCNVMICIGQMRYGTTKEHYHEICALHEKYGTMIMIKDELENDKIDYEVANKVGYASLAGWHVVDEPGTSLWVDGHDIYSNRKKDENGEPMLMSISKKQEHIEWNEKYPRKLFYINLLPVNSPKRAFVLGAHDYNVQKNVEKLWDKYEKLAEYEYYYKSYIDDFKPEVLSYDFYPLWANGLGCDAHLFFPELNARHFEQLAVIRRYTQDYSIKKNGAEVPFWNFVEISSWGDSRSGARAPIMSEVEWQINTAFVFGSKGYQYYCYNDYGDISGKGKPTTWTNTPIKVNGIINENAYAMVKLANARAQAMAKWLLNASVDHIAQYGDNPQDEVISSESFVPRDKDFKWALKSSEGKNHLVSYMKYYANNNEYADGVEGDVRELYFVCNNHNLPVNNGEITLNFDREVEGSYIYDKKERRFKGKSLTVNCCAGEGFAVLLDK